MIVLPDSINLRFPRPEDVVGLHRLIIESTGGSTKITTASLYDDLFSHVRNSKPEVKINDASVKFDPASMRSNKPIAQAIVADEGGELVGYLIFQYFYTPWSGHSASVVDLFVTANHRRRGITKKLIESLRSYCKTEGLKAILINAGYINKDQISVAIKNGFRWYRNENTDWSVLRIDFKADST